MFEQKAGTNVSNEDSSKFQITPPSVNLPKGGGAIRGIGEKFAANPVTGTGSMTVPISTTPGRSGFGPQLSLSYDSGAGNGPFGFGWNLSLPSITRKTDKGLPRYRDVEESDVFILSGVEDLVPLLIKDENGKWVRESLPPRIVKGVPYKIQRYRPRVEGLFARIERWTNGIDPADVFWRSISRENITTWYGRSPESRIADPADPGRIFSWLICESHDDKGNVIVYRYKGENAEGVFEDAQGKPVSAANERNRERGANRYLKRIFYGNREPYHPVLTEKEWSIPPDTSPSDDQPGFFFEVVFDYGEGHLTEEVPDDDGRILARALCYPPQDAQWAARSDPFSNYRAGFEVRTYRRCRRILMFHHFPAELGTPDYPVRSTDLTYSSRDNTSPGNYSLYSFLTSICRSGYVRQTDGRYLKKSLPPLQFDYSKPEVQSVVHEVDPESMDNLPAGFGDATCLWTDLHGEGIPGILTEQAGAWFYKRNLSPVGPKSDEDASHPEAKFAPVEPVAAKPGFSLSGGAQLMDLAGDGRPDLVMTAGPVSGFFEHDNGEGWEEFRPFTSCINRDMRDPNLRLIDLDGDGRADVLITEDHVLAWHPSLGENGFGPAELLPKPYDEEMGPALVFADGTHSIYLADLSGDGLSDLVRIRNGEVCYWPNLGYGRFGAKVTMDNSPWFDLPDLFDQKRIRLADIDGSGTTDILYLHADGPRIHLNQSGNSWSDPIAIGTFPQVDELSSIQVIDFLGNGTACLVWSSPLPGDARRPMRYVNLMGRQKPHLLVATKNNLGAETHVEYAPSTKFYLQDKHAGKPWITKLPFPVHVVEKVSMTDKWRGTTFTTTYSYHHGYFDGTEREFRGFGRVEQIDVEDYGTFSRGNAASPYITADKKLYQPPVKTVTWYHTGVFINRQRILSQFENEYFPHWFEAARTIGADVPGRFREKMLPEPELDEEGLSAGEWQEALRACKGMLLRQEVYELDLEALQQGEHRPVKLFTAAGHNCLIQRLQPRGDNRHGVFLVAESEAVTYHYELDLRPNDVRPDPRISHTLNLQYDEYANVLQSVAVVYPRRGKIEDDPEQAEGIADSLSLIHELQEELHLSYIETRYTGDFGSRPEEGDLSLDNHRLRAPCEVLTYELTGIRPEDGDDLAGPDLQDGSYFTTNELRRFRLSPVHQQSGEFVTDFPYHQQQDRNKPGKRLVEHLRILFFKDDGSTLDKPLPLGESGRLGLPFESYKLALTKELLDSVFVDDSGSNLLDLPAGQTGTARRKLDEAYISGYLSGQESADLFDGADANRFPPVDSSGQYWIRSGTAGFEPDAPLHFYLPERYIDPFGNVTTLEYDEHDLFVKSSMDALGNKTEVTAFDYRVLTPAETRDLNGNYSSVAFDVLGLPVATAVMGKDRSESGDSLADLRPDLTSKEVSEFFTKGYDPTVPAAWLDAATVRFVYDLGELSENGVITYCNRPPGACAIMREKHVARLEGGENRIQVAVEYSDGTGGVLVRKGQAEAAEGSSTLRWIATGKTILNNKGKPVKQYEPYFSETEHRFDATEATREVGVTPVIYYDAVGRVIRTEHPEGTFSLVEFSPWHVTAYDPNDTVAESRWYVERGAPGPKDSMPADGEARAAWLAVQHADTSSTTILDSLGREVVAVAHNRIRHPDGIHEFGGKKFKDVKYVTFTKLDAEGKPLWIRDALGNLVMQYIAPAKANNDPSDAMPGESVPCYDIAGNLLFQRSMDAGDRWMIMDAAGKPMLAWDINETPHGNDGNREMRIHSTDYDALHRPTAQWLGINLQLPVMAERYEYQDAKPNDPDNLNGQLVRHYEPSGLNETVRRDFKGNSLQVQRQLNNQPEQCIIDWGKNPTASLDSEIYIKITEYDALNRMTRLYNWHRDVTIDAGGAALPTPGASDCVAIYEPRYNERGLLVSEWLHMRAKKRRDTSGNAVPDSAGALSQQAIERITYNEKGKKTSLRLGNGTLTQYEYDDTTFRLKQIRTTRPSNGSGFPLSRSNLSDPFIIQQLLYTYDPVGNITEVEDQAYKPVFFQNSIVEPKSLYEYDALYRLVSAKGRENGALAGPPSLTEGDCDRAAFPVTDRKALRKYIQTYQYDGVGNIVQMRHQAGLGSWTRDYSYAFDDPSQRASNRLWQTWTGGDRTQAATFGYDAHGNMLNPANTDPQLEQQWDHRDMIRQIDLGGGGTACYQYDAGRQRTRKRIVKENGSGYSERIYLGGYEIYREYLGGTLVKRIESVHLYDGDQRLLSVEDVSRRSDNGMASELLFRYQYGNHLGSAVLELNEQAKVVSYEEYHPYGTTAYRAMNADIRAEAKRYRYTGKERDGESGLYYHGARYYAPWLGRWVSCDPKGLVDGVGLYRFCKNNPMTLTDPNGMQTSPAPNPNELRAALKEMVKNSAQGMECSVHQTRGSTSLVSASGSPGTVSGPPNSFSLAHSHIPSVDPTSTPSARKGASDMSTLRAETQMGGPREHAIHSPNERSLLQFSKTGDEAKVTTFKPNGEVVVRDMKYTPGSPTNLNAGETDWVRSKTVLNGRDAAIARTEAVLSSPLGEFAAESGGGRAAPLLTAGKKLMEGGGKALAVAGALAGGVQVGTGVNQIVVEGNLKEGGANLLEGSGSLGLTIGVPLALKVAAGKAAFGATSLTGVASAGAGAVAVSAGAVASAGVVGYGIGKALDTGFNVSDYSSQAGAAVYEKMKKAGINDTASFITGGIVSFYAIIPAIGYGAAAKVAGLFR